MTTPFEASKSSAVEPLARRRQGGLWLTFALAGLSLGVIGCGGGPVGFSIGGVSVDEAAEALIEDELADQLGLEFDATCDEVEDAEVGSEFQCTALTGDNEVAEFDAVVDREDHININTANIVTGEALVQIEDQAGESLSEQAGTDITVDCGGDQALVIDDDRQLDCMASNSNGEQGATLTIKDMDTGEFTVELDEAPAGEGLAPDEAELGSSDFSIGGVAVSTAAENLIEGELADQLNLDFEATCEEVVDAEIGSEFACTAITGDDKLAKFDAVVDREDHINVNTANVVVADAMVLIEDKAGEVLGEQLNLVVNVDCGGAQAMVLDDNFELDCVVSGDAGEQGAKLTITDTETGQFTIRLV